MAALFSRLAAQTQAAVDNLQHTSRSRKCSISSTFPRLLRRYLVTLCLVQVNTELTYEAFASVLEVKRKEKHGVELACWSGSPYAQGASMFQLQRTGTTRGHKNCDSRSQSQAQSQTCRSRNNSTKYALYGCTLGSSGGVETQACLNTASLPACAPDHICLLQVNQSCASLTAASSVTQLW